MQIKVLTGYDGECLHRDLTLKNFSEYCSRWGYELIAKFGGWKPVDAQRLASAIEVAVSEATDEHCLQTYTWQKHVMIREEFHDCDWLLWIDADCKILNMTIPLESFIDDTFDLAIIGRNPDDWADYCGVIPYSSSFLLLRNCEWSHKMLQEWWDTETPEGPGWRVGKNHNCKSLGDNNWFSCILMETPGHRKHVKPIDYAVAGDSHWLGTGEQWLTHLYASSQQDRLDVLAWLEGVVIRDTKKLGELARECHRQTDKIGHGYLPHYHARFESLIHHPAVLLEIGIYGGDSLRLWRDYFLQGRIYGLDIDPATLIEEARIKSFLGKQEDVDCLQAIVAETGPLDIVIDDGSHFATHHVCSFLALWPHVKPGGWYVIEDCSTLWNECWTQPGDRTILDVLNDDREMILTGRSDIAEVHVISDRPQDGLIFIRKRK